MFYVTHSAAAHWPAGQPTWKCHMKLTSSIDCAATADLINVWRETHTYTCTTWLLPDLTHIYAGCPSHACCILCRLSDTTAFFFFFCYRLIIVTHACSVDVHVCLNLKCFLNGLNSKLRGRINIQCVRWPLPCWDVLEQVSKLIHPLFHCAQLYRALGCKNFLLPGSVLFWH